MKHWLSNEMAVTTQMIAAAVNFVTADPIVTEVSVRHLCEVLQVS